MSIFHEQVKVTAWKEWQYSAYFEEAKTWRRDLLYSPNRASMNGAVDLAVTSELCE